MSKNVSERGHGRVSWSIEGRLGKYCRGKVKRRPTSRFSELEMLGAGRLLSGCSLGSLYRQLPWLAAAVIELEIFEKIRLMLVETPGMIDPAATATNPAIRAYSIRS